MEKEKRQAPLFDKVLNYFGLYRIKKNENSFVVGVDMDTFNISINLISPISMDFVYGAIKEILKTQPNGKNNKVF